jgi:hypothetical protein
MSRKSSDLIVGARRSIRRQTIHVALGRGPACVADPDRNQPAEWLQAAAGARSDLDRHGRRQHAEAPRPGDNIGTITQTVRMYSAGSDPAFVNWAITGRRVYDGCLARDRAGEQVCQFIKPGNLIYV